MKRAKRTWSPEYRALRRLAAGKPLRWKGLRVALLALTRRNEPLPETVNLLHVGVVNLKELLDGC